MRTDRNKLDREVLLGRPGSRHEVHAVLEVEYSTFAAAVLRTETDVSILAV